MIWTQITDFMVIILIIAAIAAASMRDIKSCIVLLIVVVLNVIIGFVQEFKADRALEALMSLSVPKVRVVISISIYVLSVLKLFYLCCRHNSIIFVNVNSLRA
jgi:magnesium-transporting ATPase (P-type)